MPQPPTLKGHIESFLDEWEKTILHVRDAIERKDFESAGSTHTLQGVKGAGNYINDAGWHNLTTAAELLLRKEHAEFRYSVRTAQRALEASFGANLEKARTTGSFSPEAIVDGAVQRLRDTPTADGTFVFPIIFAPSAKQSDFRLGPMRILTKEIFNHEYGAVLQKEREDHEDTLRLQLLEDWEAHLAEYDHILTVAMSGFESEMAWSRAREAAEYFLNLVRMMFNWSTTRNIRVGGGFAWETKQSKLMISSAQEAVFSSSMGPWGSVLDDTWMEALDQNLGWFANNLASFAFWLVSGAGTRNPILERLRYTHTLIAEAYSEPHDHIRLVRIVSALEALMVLGGEDMAHQLAVRCASVGGWGEPGIAVSIYDAVREAYRVRSAVVHGNSLTRSEVRRPFHRLELNLLRIVIGQMILMTEIAHRVRPQSVRALRRAIDARIEYFFYEM